MQEQFRQQYPLLNPDRELYDQKDLIVNIQPLRDQLTEIGKDLGVSIYFELLNTGANIAINKDVQIWPASLMKIPIALAVMRKVEAGEWNMDKDFVLMEGDKNQIFGNLYKSPTGTHFTLKKLLDEMLINSDNTARNIFVRSISPGDLDDVLEHLGVEFDYRNDGQITAKRYSIFWRALFSSTYLNPESSHVLIKIMSQSSANNFLAKGVPSETIFSHKIGVLYAEKIYADSGIIYVTNRPYILTVMIDGHSQDEAEKIMKDISEKTFKYVSQYPK